MLFFSKCCVYLLGWHGLAVPSGGRPIALASLATCHARVWEAPADSSQRVTVLSGRCQKGYSWALAPGDSYALKFLPPVTGQQALYSVRLYLEPFGRHVAQGQVRVRIVGVAADGSPANDASLLLPRLLTTQTLQVLNDQPLTLAWPTAHLLVPSNGLFVVLEGVGEYPDDYIITSPRVVLAGKSYSHVGRRSQPDAVPRLLSTWSIPSITGAQRTNPQPEFWMRGGDLPGWRSFPEQKRLPLIEVCFE